MSTDLPGRILEAFLAVWKLGPWLRTMPAARAGPVSESRRDEGYLNAYRERRGLGRRRGPCR